MSNEKQPIRQLRGDDPNAPRVKKHTLGLADTSAYRMKDSKEKSLTFRSRQGEITIPAKGDVEFGEATPRLRNFIGEIATDLNTQELPFDFVITSGSEGEHSVGSKHYTGQAVDIRIAPKFRGSKEGQNTPWDDPMYKYFYEGKGRDILSKYKMNLLDDLEHGSAAHIHIEEGSERRKGGDIKTQSDFEGKTIQGESPIVGTPNRISGGDLVNGEVTNFLAEVSNEATKVEAKEKEISENPALNLLKEKQLQRQKLKEDYINFAQNQFVNPKKEQPLQPTGGYRPNQLVQTQFRTLEQAVGLPQFEDGGEVDPKKKKGQKTTSKKDIERGRGRFKSSVIFDDGDNLYYRAKNVDPKLFSQYETDEKTGMYVVPKTTEVEPTNIDLAEKAIKSDLPEGYRKTYDPSRSADPFDYYFTDPKTGIEKRITNKEFIDATNDPEAILKEKLDL